MNIANVKGFKCQGITAGIKASGKKDLAILFSEKPCVIAATYTRNLVIAEPLKLNKKNLKNSKAQAIVCNSGNANACTGKQGYDAAVAMTKQTAKSLNINAKDVVVLSTGVIGRTFPTNIVLKGIDKCASELANTQAAGKNAAEAILTTDTVTKEYYTDFMIGNTKVSIGGIAKGSGMIHPNMGTMLAFIVSDCKINQLILDHCFKDAVDRSFNMISVDGDTSTNDMAIIMCNGTADNKSIKNIDSKGYRLFSKKLYEVCTELAKMIVKDGEGVTKFIEYKVINAKTQKDARQIIRTMSGSSLVKTAMYGNDPNWGRLIAAAGRAGVHFNPDKTDLYVGDIPMLIQGQPVKTTLPEAEKLLKKKEIYITLNLNKGDAFGIGWGTDLTVEYVKFNADYTT
jgi:glutamate N-acetyltransferase/amino-acid N-acetyltransferase